MIKLYVQLMMNQLPNDIQIIVYKYVHKYLLSSVFKDIILKLRQVKPLLSPAMNVGGFDLTLNNESGWTHTYYGVYVHVIRGWFSSNSYLPLIPYWYSEYSTNFPNNIDKRVPQVFRAISAN